MSRPPGVYLDVPDPDYFTDDAFSQSQAKQLLESPARYRWSQDHPEKPKAAFDVGHAAHAKVLGRGSDIVTIPATLLSPGEAIRSAAAKKWEADAIAEGKVVIKPKVAAEVDAMAEAVLAKPEARRLLELPGDSEVSMWWRDTVTGVECRGRVDRLIQCGDQVVNLDLKSTNDATLYGFSKSAADYGYHVQDAAYDDGFYHITGERLPCVLIAVEKAPPHLVALFEFTPTDVDAGLAMWRKALRLLTTCRAQNRWPGHPDHIQTLTLPRWARTERAA